MDQVIIPQLAASHVHTLVSPPLAPYDVTPPQKLAFSYSDGWLIAVNGGIIQPDTSVQDFVLLSACAIRMFINDEDELIHNGQTAAFGLMADLFSEYRRWFPLCRRMSSTDELFVLFRNVSANEQFAATLTFAFLRDSDLMRG